MKKIAWLIREEKKDFSLEEEIQKDRDNKMYMWTNPTTLLSIQITTDGRDS